MSDLRFLFPHYGTRPLPGKFPVACEAPKSIRGQVVTKVEAVIEFATGDPNPQPFRCGARSRSSTKTMWGCVARVPLNPNGGPNPQSQLKFVAYHGTDILSESEPVTLTHRRGSRLDSEAKMFTVTIDYPEEDQVLSGEDLDAIPVCGTRDSGDSVVYIKLLDAPNSTAGELATVSAIVDGTDWWGMFFSLSSVLDVSVQEAWFVTTTTPSSYRRVVIQR